MEKPNPYDDGQGWIRIYDGVLGPVWSCGPVIPNSLVDILDIDDMIVKKKRRRRKTRTSLILNISMKAVDVLTIIILKPMKDIEARQNNSYS